MSTYRESNFKKQLLFATYKVFCYMISIENYTKKIPFMLKEMLNISFVLIVFYFLKFKNSDSNSIIIIRK